MEGNSELGTFDEAHQAHRGLLRAGRGTGAGERAEGVARGHLVLRVATDEEGATASPAVAYVAVFKYGDFEIKINFYQRHVVTAHANGEDVLGRGLHSSTFLLNLSRF